MDMVGSGFSFTDEPGFFNVRLQLRRSKLIAKIAVGGRLLWRQVRRLFICAGFVISLAHGAFAGAEPEASGRDRHVGAAVWQLGIGATATFNAKTSFEGYGGLALASAPPMAGGAPTFAVYDDGFVLADISGSTALTTNWGYQSSGQVDASGGGGGGSIVLSTATGIGTAGVDETNGGAPGVEIQLRRSLPGLSQPHLDWSFEIALGYMDFSVDNDSVLSTGLNRVSDAFPLNGVVPPLAPYNGSFTGPGPLLGTTPERSADSVPGAVAISGKRKLKVDLYTLRLGPRLDARVNERLSLQLSGGLALAYADGSYRFSSTARYPGGSQARSGRNDGGEWLTGWYVGIGADWRLSDSWSLFGRLEHRGFENFKIRAAGTSAALSFDQTFTASGGISYRF